MAKKMLRGGLVGSGFAARFHLAAMQRVYGVDLQVAGVWSVPLTHAEEFARKHEIDLFPTYEALLEAVDVVHVVTPPSSHESLAVQALGAGRSVIIEKPLTGYFGDGSEGYLAHQLARQEALAGAIGSLERLAAAERDSRGRIFYAENWVYAPAVQKEREILEKTGAQIVRMLGEQSHSGSHAPTYGYWRFSGGGSLISKGCHPLSAALYLKRVEGGVRNGRPIRPATVSCRTHELVRMPGYRDEGHLRRDYHDIEDFAQCHVVFEDGTVADIFASEVVLGGVHNWIEVMANNHRSRININPNDAMMTFNPAEESFRDVYVLEKIETKQGWACTSPDEAWFTGYQHEMEDFYCSVARDEEPQSGSGLGIDCISTIYAAYLSAENQGVEVTVPRV